MNLRSYRFVFAFLLVGLLLLIRPAAAKDVRPRSPFAGTWAGTYTAMMPNNTQEGEITATVDDQGNVKGEVWNKTVNQNATLKGTVNEDGKIKIVFEFPNQNQPATADGTVARTRKGWLTGTMTQRFGMQATGSIEFDVKPKLKQ